ncbi:malate synthase A [Legionella waltersii]|uniref:malate synthase n=1 Tax=Legionella waltersii TaxID=66969 RepID=A0A0W1AMY3_9GAMM|nr:malate synthase A [Legionella waltersii]KTD82715.1 Malate synthase A [Legionella waltersii]SNV03427.1 Malate synthase A [Legionella waltersii]
MKTESYLIAGTLDSSNNFILNDDSLQFISSIERYARSRRKELLQTRSKRQADFDQGIFPDFLKETANLRQSDWVISPAPEDLQDRRVEITGPVNRKMIINALNSGAKTFMADFEDSNSPTWTNCLEGQLNLYDAVRKTISYTDPETGKKYQLNKNTAVLIVRPRGLHLDECHVHVDEEPVSAPIFDTLLYLYHNAKQLIEQGTAPYFYIPKIESHQEARWWNDVFTKAEQYLNLPHGTIKVTVLIETITAVFEMNEIIHELKDYIVGLNCGRWDYMFSFIKKFRNHPQFLLPNRQQLTMTSHFLKSYVTLLIHTCHKRGIHAMGGMAAQIPIKGDEKANTEAMNLVYADKLREASMGHDGTWVAHPGLIPIALEAFNKIMPQANQLSKMVDASEVTQNDLLTVPEGNISEQGVRRNISVALLYLESWLNGNGCVPIHHLMEDAATAEICRSQLWQWLKFSAPLSNGSVLDASLLTKLFNEEVNLLLQDRKNEKSIHALNQAKEILETLVFNNQFNDFLTTVAYPYLMNERTSS